MSCRKPSKNGKLSLSDTAENKRQDSAGRGKISGAGFSTSDAAGSTSSLPAQPQWEAPKHGLPRIAQLDKAKKEGAKYQEQKEQVLPGEERKLQTHADSLSGSRRLCGRRKLRSSELPGPDRQRHDLRNIRSPLPMPLISQIPPSAKMLRAAFKQRRKYAQTGGLSEAGVPSSLTVRPCENQNDRKLIYAQGSLT